MKDNTEVANETSLRHPAKEDRPQPSSKTCANEQASQPACAKPARATKMKDITIGPENLLKTTTTRGGSENESTNMTTIEEHNLQPVKKTETSAKEDRPQPSFKTRAKIERHLLQALLLMRPTGTMNAEKAGQKPSTELTSTDETMNAEKAGQKPSTELT